MLDLSKYSVFLPRFLFSLTIFAPWCQTGFSSTNPRQSHRVHPVHAAEEPYPPARHWRPEEAEHAVGAAGWVWLIFLVRQYPHAVWMGVWFICLPSTRCSPCPGEGQGQRPDPDKLLVWQQPVHKPQGQRRVGLRRRLRLQLRIGTGRAAQQKEATHGAQLDSAMQEPLPLPRLPKQTLFAQRTRRPHNSHLSALCPTSLQRSRRRAEDSVKEVLSCIKTLLPAFCAPPYKCHSAFLRLCCSAPPPHRETFCSLKCHNINS